MRARSVLLLAGAAGLVLAALIYLVARRVQGAFSFLILIPAASFIFFLLLWCIALVEIVVMTYALRRLAAQLPGHWLNLIAVGYVAFASVYALTYALLVPDERGIQILAAFCVVRWFTLFFIAPVSQTK